MMRAYLDQLTPDKIAAIHVAFSIARDWDNCKVCQAAGEANCGDEYENVHLEAARESLQAAEEAQS